jgi:glycosyltransferase involved in cell wall biosynthesis
MEPIGIVAIGRNEGERLRRCIDALAGVGATIVYVDSDSTDESVALARARGAEVVQLDMSLPFSAARARNTGFERLLRINPEVRFVQFLDGDCEVVDGWLELGRRTLEDRPEAAVVFGRLNERFPERSIYNRLADIEWNMAIADGNGETALACGGNAMIRAEAFRAAGGYDASIPAGEEPELCRRLRRAGWSVVRLDADMCWHDSEMVRFGQWARRQVRTGYGGLDFSTRFGRPGDDPFRRQVRSARFWALGWPLALIVTGSLAAARGGPAYGLAAGLVLVALPAQAIRIAARNRARARGLGAALAYGFLTQVGKFFQVAGQCLYIRDRLSGRHARLIEYKPAAPAAEAGRSLVRDLAPGEGTGRLIPSGAEDLR